VLIGLLATVAVFGTVAYMHNDAESTENHMAAMDDMNSVKDYVNNVFDAEAADYEEEHFGMCENPKC